MICAIENLVSASVHLTAMIEHRQIRVNGIQMHIAEQGTGPLVILCHGFPETWYSWRHQIGPLADRGWHIIAPDQRGYGQTERPREVASYDILNLVADIVAIVKLSGYTTAAVVGNDWGSLVAAHCALLRPDIFRQVALLSVPYLPRIAGTHSPTEVLQRMYRGKEFYQLFFQQPGRAEAQLEQDVRQSLLMLFYSLSGEALPEKRWRPVVQKAETILDWGGLPEKMPNWLSENDLETLTQEFRRTGFAGGLNWYRNIDRNWKMTAFLVEATINQPSLFLAGERDPILEVYRNYEKLLEKSMPNLKGRILLDGVGHWTTLEDTESVTQHIAEFLSANCTG